MNTVKILKDMPLPHTPEALTALSERLSQYATCVLFTQWLIENGILLTGTAINTNPEALAYDFAVRFSNEQAELERIIGVKL